MYSLNEMYWATKGLWYWLKSKIRPKKYVAPDFRSMDKAWKDRVAKYRDDLYKAFIANMQDQVKNSKPDELPKETTL